MGRDVRDENSSSSSKTTAKVSVAVRTLLDRNSALELHEERKKDSVKPNATRVAPSSWLHCPWSKLEFRSRGEENVVDETELVQQGPASVALRGMRRTSGPVLGSERCTSTARQQTLYNLPHALALAR